MSNLLPNPGVDLFFSSLGRIMRLAGLVGRNKTEDEIKDAVVNWDFQDETSCSQWHFIFKDSKITVGRGLKENVRSTIQIKPATFYSLFAGKTDFPTVRMTGRVRTVGDPNFVYLVGYLTEKFRKSFEMKGLKGVVRQRFANKVLKKMAPN